MAYRDDLEAAHARIAQLERELRDHKAKTARLWEGLEDPSRALIVCSDGEIWDPNDNPTA